MMMIVFRSRLKSGLDEAALEELEALGRRMSDLAARMPGFLSHADYASADGEIVTLVFFASEETLRAWREHPDHLEAQRLGRERFLASYQIDVGPVARTMRWSIDNPQP
jgi:heme-degrading monooxygenase HmoA